MPTNSTPSAHTSRQMKPRPQVPAVSNKKIASECRRCCDLELRATLGGLGGYELRVGEEAGVRYVYADSP